MGNAALDGPLLRRPFVLPQLGPHTREDERSRYFQYVGLQATEPSPCKMDAGRARCKVPATTMGLSFNVAAASGQGLRFYQIKAHGRRRKGERCDQTAHR